MAGYHNRIGMIQLTPVLLAVAVVGYLLGGSHAGAGVPAAKTTFIAHTAAVSNPVVLEYPSASNWQVASGAPELSGLPIAQSLVLAPAGNAHDAGLLAGQMSVRNPTPLPVRFLASLSGVPRGEVVSLLTTQAYRYARLTPSQSKFKITLYVIPGVSGNAATIACYAARSAAASSYLDACERLVGKLTLQVEAQSQILPPNVEYADKVSEVMVRVDKLRAEVRPGMRSGAAPVTVSALASRLAGGFSQALRSLSAIQPPSPVSLAQVTLSKALTEARAAYLALASAAGADGQARYEAARARVYNAEAHIVSALKDYSLLGYE